MRRVHVNCVVFLTTFLSIQVNADDKVVTKLKTFKNEVGSVTMNKEIFEIDLMAEKNNTINDLRNVVSQLINDTTSVVFKTKEKNISHCLIDKNKKSTIKVPRIGLNRRRGMLIQVPSLSEKINDIESEITNCFTAEFNVLKKHNETLGEIMLLERRIEYKDLEENNQKQYIAEKFKKYLQNYPATSRQTLDNCKKKKIETFWTIINDVKHKFELCASLI